MIAEFFNYLKTSETAMYAAAFSTLTPIVYMAPRYAAGMVSKVKSMMLATYEIHYSDHMNDVIDIWMAHHTDYFKFLRSYNVKSVSNEAEDDDSPVSLGDKGSQHELHFPPGYGRFIMKIPEFGYAMFRRNRDELVKEATHYGGPPDIIYMTVPVWKKVKLRTLFKQMDQEVTLLEKKKTGIKVHTLSSHGFSRASYEQNFKQEWLLPQSSRDVMADAEAFLARIPWLKDNGIRPRRGYLLHGAPGTGKSSVVQVLADKLGYPVYNIPSSMLTSFSVALLYSIPERAIVLFEDIDDAGIKNREEEPEKTDKKGPPMLANKGTLSSLLNALDGIQSCKAQFIFATTNKPDELDAALKRPGRFDVIREIGNLSPDISTRYAKHFFQREDVIVTREMTAADLHEAVVRNIDTPENFIQEMA